MPDQALQAFIDHGKISRTIDTNVSKAEGIYCAFEKLGIDWGYVDSKLEDEGVEAFKKSLTAFLTPCKRRQTLLNWLACKALVICLFCYIANHYSPSYRAWALDFPKIQRIPCFSVALFTKRNTRYNTRTYIEGDLTFMEELFELFHKEISRHRKASLDRRDRMLCLRYDDLMKNTKVCLRKLVSSWGILFPWRKKRKAQCKKLWNSVVLTV
ncbi:hypothetical protein QQP08_013864 [Theobroma cacao]|nr:hypothetical protein QQP08_013864 [Theobroma cacao]